MRRPFLPHPDHARDTSGVHVSLDELLRLRVEAHGFSLRPKQPLRSALAGRRASKLRGRGLDFEELRGYLPGDDVRTIDWKATARLCKPHVRVHLEERDRPCVLVIDQRRGMFFGSRSRMKSVTAAHVAALAGWRAFEQDDRVGAVLFNDTEVVVVPPRRQEATVARILGEVTRLDHLLRADLDVPDSPGQFATALSRAARLVPHDGLVVVASDFAGADPVTPVGSAATATSRIRDAADVWRSIARHNDTVAAFISDPLERALPHAAHLTFQDRDGQIEVDTRSKQLRRGFGEHFAARRERAEAFLRRVETPVVRLGTEDDVAKQLRRELGMRPGSAR